MNWTSFIERITQTAGRDFTYEVFVMGNVGRSPKPLLGYFVGNLVGAVGSCWLGTSSEKYLQEIR